MSDPTSRCVLRAERHEYLELDWAMFGELCRALALKVARDYDPEIIVGIERAGVIPAAVIASILEVDFYSLKIGRPRRRRAGAPASGDLLGVPPRASRAGAC
jgi:uncharacterized protein